MGNIPNPEKMLFPDPHFPLSLQFLCFPPFPPCPLQHQIRWLSPQRATLGKPQLLCLCFIKAYPLGGREILYSHPEEAGWRRLPQTSQVLWVERRGEEAEAWSQSQEQRGAAPHIKQPTRKAASLERDGHIVCIDRNISSFTKIPGLPAWHGNSRRPLKLRTEMTSSQPIPSSAKTEKPVSLGPQRFTLWKMARTGVEPQGRSQSIPRQTKIPLFYMLTCFSRDLVE